MRASTKKSLFLTLKVLVGVALLAWAVAWLVHGVGATNRNAYRAAERSDLRNLSSAQEMYYDGFGDQPPANTYSDDPATLEIRWSDGVDIVITEADSLGWAARSSHESLPGLGCAVFVGDATPPETPRGRTPEEEGTIVCDDRHRHPLLPW